MAEFHEENIEIRELREKILEQAEIIDQLNTTLDKNQVEIKRLADERQPTDIDLMAERVRRIYYFVVTVVVIAGGLLILDACSPLLR